MKKYLLLILLLLMAIGGIPDSCFGQSLFPARITGPVVAADIAYDTGSQGDQTSGATLTVSHTVASDANCLVTFIASYLSGAGGGQSVTVTHNGDAMTSAGVVTAGDDEYELFYRLNPDVGIYNIVATPSSSSCELAMVSGSFKNVASVDNYTTDSGVSYPFDLTVPSNTGSWAIAGLGCYNRTVDVVTTGTERVTNENGGTQLSCWLFSKTGSGIIDGELSGSTEWRFLGIRGNK